MAKVAFTRAAAFLPTFRSNFGERTASESSVRVRVVSVPFCKGRREAKRASPASTAWVAAGAVSLHGEDELAS